VCQGEEFVVSQGKDGMWCSARRPDRCVVTECFINHRAQLRGMSHRSDAADRLAGDFATTQECGCLRGAGHWSSPEVVGRQRERSGC
jgi:hypothetical protein